MKKLKKLASVALALVMAMALMAPAFATAGQSNNTITVTNAEKGAHYTLYKIFNASVASDRVEDGNGITYSLISGTEIPAQLKDVFVLNTAKKTIEVVTPKPADSVIMTAIKDYIAAASLTAVAGPIEGDGKPVVFTGLADGYYAVVSDAVENPTAVSLTSIAPNASVKEKNFDTTIEQPDGGTKDLVDANGNVLTDKSVAIGETVYYKISEIGYNWLNEDNDDSNGAEYKVTSYHVYDSNPSFLTGLHIYKVTVTEPGQEPVEVTGYGANAVEWDIPWVENVGGVETHKYAPGSTINVYYTGTVNANILTATDARNSGYLLPNGYDVPTDLPHEDVETFKFDFMKHDQTNAPLANATFSLYTTVDGTTPLNLVKITDNVYRLADGVDAAASIVTEITTDSTGKIEIRGLAKDTYYLAETEAPAGYNKVSTRTPVDMTNGSIATSLNGDVWTGVHVENVRGALLPETGGIGTTIFYALGGVLLVGSAVLFVTKKRLGE